MARKITAEFKHKCVDLVLIHGYRYKDAADAMGVGLSSIQRWVSQFKSEEAGETPKATALTPEQDEYKNWRNRLSNFKLTINC